MTTFTPPTFLNTNPSGQYYISGSQEYKRYSAHASDSSTNVYYTLHYIASGNSVAQHAVYFDTVSLQWVDGSTGASEWPTVITQSSTLSNGDSVEFKKTDGTVIYKFDMVGLSTSSGSGPSPLSTGTTSTQKKVFCNFW